MNTALVLWVAGIEDDLNKGFNRALIQWIKEIPEKFLLLKKYLSSDELILNWWLIYKKTQISFKKELRFWLFIWSSGTVGEVVFNTGMTGYQEVITDQVTMANY